MTRPDTDRTNDVLRNAEAIVFSWHGVLYDAGRTAIHQAIRDTLAHWGVEVTDAELTASRGPTGRPQLERVFSTARIAEAYRCHHHRWVTESDLDVMMAYLEPRLLAAAQIASTPNVEACAAIRRLNDRGIKTAVVCCTSRKLLAPQLDALIAAGIPLDAIITADEACAPAPAPWGLFEVQRVLGITDANHIVLVDDCAAGAAAAANAGARSIALLVAGTPAPKSDATIACLSEIA